MPADNPAGRAAARRPAPGGIAPAAASAEGKKSVEVNWRPWMALVAGGWLLACLGLAALGAHQVQYAGVRCYALTQPLTHYEQILLEAGALDCIYQQCRVTIKLTPQRGWTCFFPRTWHDSRSPSGAQGAQFTGGNGAQGSASRKSSGLWVCRTA